MNRGVEKDVSAFLKQNRLDVSSVFFPKQHVIHAAELGARWIERRSLELGDFLQKASQLVGSVFCIVLISLKDTESRFYVLLKKLKRSKLAY